jgi:hypothetical protein
MKAIVRRIRNLEVRAEARIEATRKPTGPSAAEILAERLANFGIVRGPSESLIETTARAFGWKVKQLRAELERRAYGGGT